MPIIILIFPTLFLLVFSILFFASGMKKRFFASVFVFLCISVWFFCSISKPIEVYRTETVTVSDVNGASAIAYKDYNDKLVIINLNKTLEKNIPIGTKVKVIIPKYIYAGLSYETMIPDKYVILTESP